MSGAGIGPRVARPERAAGAVGATVAFCPDRGDGSEVRCGIGARAVAAGDFPAGCRRKVLRRMTPGGWGMSAASRVARLEARRRPGVAFLVVHEDAEGRLWQWDEDPPVAVDAAAMSAGTMLVVFSTRPDGPQ